MVAADAIGEDHIRHPMSYGDPLPDAIGEGANVVIVDYCPPAEQLEAIAVVAKSLTILDHHATATAILIGWLKDSQGAPIAADWFESNSKLEFRTVDPEQPCNITVTLDMKRSGAGLSLIHI